MGEHSSKKRSLWIDGKDVLKDFLDSIKECPELESLHGVGENTPRVFSRCCSG